jgi:hypothetical protein
LHDFSGICFKILVRWSHRVAVFSLAHTENINHQTASI